METTTRNAGKSELLEAIKVDMKTGAISYPKVEEFELDAEQVYRTAQLFMPHAGSAEMAVRLAIHGQIAAHLGARQLFAREGR
jgi:hypothetical protein